LNESFFPGWSATIDSKAASIYRVNAIVRGVPVDAGRHLVEFHYRPASLRQGAAISLATLGAASLLVWSRSRKLATHSA
jgi:uncharacterized membrane protein YfhO